MPTICYLLEQGAKVILISHLGRPKGKVVDSLRMAIVAQRLSQILGKQVGVATDCIGPEVEKSVALLKNGDLMLLENLRFHSSEETGMDSFAQELARLGDIFVNDAFGTSHRAHASISGIAKYLPAVAGLLMKREIEMLGSIMADTKHPFAVITGGAKVSDKVKLLKNMMDKIEYLLIGGGMAATFLKARSYSVGKSLVEEESLQVAKELLNSIVDNDAEAVLPVDVLVADKIEASATVKVVAVADIPDDMMIVDVGPQTVKLFSKILDKCRMVFWNGPMGIHEIEPFSHGTRSIAKKLAELDAVTVIGGGSTAEVVTEMNLAEKMSFVSTGGGASIRYLGGDSLPGLETLLDKEASNGDA